jgi:HK97 family phage prohead protease
MKNKQQQLRMQVKAFAEDGTFEGILSPYGNVDEGGDCVDMGAFTKTLQENGNNVPMLWQHKQDCPIGELTLSDRPDGLYCSGKLLLDIPEAQKAYSLLKAGIVKGLSIGYEAIKAQVTNGVRHLKEIRLYEGSVVTFPMNTLATVTSVKALEEKGDFTDELLVIQLRATCSQLLDALSNSLWPIPWSGISRDEMTSLAETVIDQFREAYLQYLPQYLDYLSREYGMDTKGWSAHETKERQSCTTHLDALKSDGAGTSTPDDGAAIEHKTEPDIHSAATILTSMRSLFN